MSSLFTFTLGVKMPGPFLQGVIDNVSLYDNSIYNQCLPRHPMQILKTKILLECNGIDLFQILGGLRCHL